MISVEEAREQILRRVRVLEPEEKPILEALGQVVAEDIRSHLDVPPLDNAAMDGFAVQAANTHGASPSSPRRLRVLGEVAAGYMFQGKVMAGTAVRIMTGAPVPSGADAVVQFEDTDEEAQKKKKGQSLSEVEIYKEASSGLNIRRAGEDISRGQLLFPADTVLRPSEIGVLASLGRARVKVIRRPVVAILSTGDELVEVGHPLPPGKIYNSNSFSLAAQVKRYGGIPRQLGIARDNLESLMAALSTGMGSDLFITSAGVSMGDYDVVKDALARKGEIGFWTVRMKPGKPLAFGILKEGGREVPHLGLPGNPVSSMVTFEQFARPAILKMLGRRSWDSLMLRAICLGDIENNDGRRVFARAAVTKEDGKYYARPTGPQGSGILTSMALANGFVVVPEDVALVKEGEVVQVQMFDWGEGF
ncbi:MAG: molybdopterin molybdotransferase MoeA [Chloroflexi bacterium]|nr:molybdopterin molybdotransferase MoeA [Chloroflexota bacterium]